MIGTRWRKVLHDLWDSKVRSLLVISTIFIGVFSLGLTISMYVLLQQDMQHAYVEQNWFHAELYASPFDPDLVDRIREMPEVAAAEGRTSVGVEVRTGPDKWQSANLITTEDLGQIQINKVYPESGQWPPAKEQLALERSSMALLNTSVGQTVDVRLSDGTIRQMQVVAQVNDGLGPTALTGRGYVTFDTLEFLHARRLYNNLDIRVTAANPTQAQVEAVGEQVTKQLKNAGVEVFFTFVPTPGLLPGAEGVLGVASVIAVLGVLSVALGGFLIYNTFSALLTQHVKQIGVMKAIGARTSQIAGMYVALILIFSLIAIIPAIPLSLQAAAAIEGMLMNMFNFNTLGVRPVPAAIIAQIVVGFGVPLLAGVIPVLIGARITIHEAIGSYGMGRGQFGRSLIDRLVEKLRFLPRPQLISLRNTFRRKARLVLTLSNLVLAGAIFISVFTVRASLNNFIGEIANLVSSDATVDFNSAYPTDELLAHAYNIPGVVDVESWYYAGGDVIGEDGETVNTAQLFGPPSDSENIQPVIVAGRYLLPEDQNAVVVNTGFYRYFPDLKPGDTITIDMQGRERQWTVVGIMQWFTAEQLMGYANGDYLANLTGNFGRTYELRLFAADHSPAAQASLAQQAKDYFEAQGFQVGSVRTGSELVSANAESLGSIVVFFMVMAVLIAIVGAIGLTGTMSMNVLERTREIGVMRAIGARDRTVLMMVMFEGMLIGLFSWLLGSLLAVPLGQMMYGALSQTLFRTESTIVIDSSGFLIWLAVALGLAAIASLMPAYNAIRLTVREVLAYE